MVDIYLRMKKPKSIFHQNTLLKLRAYAMMIQTRPLVHNEYTIASLNI